MVVRLVRRPLLPGEFDAERWAPPLLVAGLALAWAVLRSGLSTPACAFRRLTDLPCLACGGTRCVRSVLAGDLAAALAYNPLVALGLAGLTLWSAHAVIARLRGDRLRLRLVTDRAGSRLLRWGLAFGLVLHWMWLAWTLPA